MVGNQPLKSQYPTLFNIVRKKQAKVTDVLSSVSLEVEFRRTLVGNKLLEWNHLVARMANINQQHGIDSFVWSLHKTGSFTVNSTYSYLISNGLKVSQVVWRLKIPLKIKIFIWFFKRGISLTKDNLAKRNWNGDRLCCFCSKPETIQHLFFDCSHMPCFYGELSIWC